MDAQYAENGEVVFAKTGQQNSRKAECEGGPSLYTCAEAEFRLCKSSAANFLWLFSLTHQPSPDLARSRSLPIVLRQNLSCRLSTVGGGSRGWRGWMWHVKGAIALPLSSCVSARCCLELSDLRLVKWPVHLLHRHGTNGVSSSCAVKEKRGLSWLKNYLNRVDVFVELQPHRAYAMAAHQVLPTIHR